jgi:hypothetical protein
MGPQRHQLLATLYVASSLALFALGSSDLTGGFCLRTLIYCMPTTIVGPILDTVVVSRDVEGASCEELGWHLNSCLLRPFTTSVRAHRFASSVVTLWDYEKSKGKVEREEDLETGERVIELTWCCLFSPSKPWRSRAGPRRRSRKSTYNTL